MIKVLYLTAECKGFVTTGGLAEVAGSLPKAIMKENDEYEIRVVMPLYKKVFESYNEELKFVAATTITLSWRNLYCGIYNFEKDGIKYYFIDNKYYFDRDNIYGYYDDGERFAFFSKSIFSLFEIIDYYPDIIHSNDWHTALVNIYLDILYKKQGYLMNVKSVFTIHNIEYQGVYGFDFAKDIIGIDEKYNDIIKYNGLVNLIKGAIVCSDIVTTVSEKYAEEIKNKEYACGLEYVIKNNSKKIKGIINGIDVEFYNPLNDKLINYNYGIDNLNDKNLNKISLQRDFGIEVNENKCLISVISRLVPHKGMDLLVNVFNEIMKEDIQLVILGQGDDYYQNKFLEFERNYKQKAKVIVDFDSKLSHRIYAASDLFLMPSKMEPCGLSQMIASRYGAVPIVRATGGLNDSIKDYSLEGNGFVFERFDEIEFLNKIKLAISVYNNKEEFHKLQKKAMEEDFSWNSSAKKYIQMYKEIIKMP